jgi:hypothetical protein
MGSREGVIPADDLQFEVQEAEKKADDLQKKNWLLARQV